MKSKTKKERENEINGLWCMDALRGRGVRVLEQSFQTWGSSVSARQWVKNMFDIDWYFFTIHNQFLFPYDVNSTVEIDRLLKSHSLDLLCTLMKSLLNSYLKMSFCFLHVKSSFSLSSYELVCICVFLPIFVWLDIMMDWVSRVHSTIIFS